MLCDFLGIFSFFSKFVRKKIDSESCNLSLKHFFIFATYVIQNSCNFLINYFQIDQELCKKSTKETSTSIIAAYVNASKQRSLHSSANVESEASNASYNEEDKCLSNDLLKEKQRQLDECLQKLKYAENRARHWKEQYNTLKKSGNYNLTEKTGKDIVTILEAISNRTIHGKNLFYTIKNIKEKLVIRESTRLLVRNVKRQIYFHITSFRTFRLFFEPSLAVQ